MKNLVIIGLVGASFLLSGFWFGLRIAPMPKKPEAKAALAASAPAAPRQAISLDTLRQASENLMSINQALQAREQVVAAREKAVSQQEEEIAAERAAMDQVHSHFKELYGEFQQRLQLVEDSETEQLERQVTIFNAMDPAQSADLIRALDDGTIVRLFSIMDAKPLSKLVAAWKTKYPNDAPRLLAALDGMGRVVAKDKIVLPDSPPPVDENAGAAPTPAPDANSTTPSAPQADGSSTSPTPDASTPATPASPSDASPTAPAPAAPAPAPTPDAAPAATPPAPAAASASSDSGSPLDTPGETAAKAAATPNAPATEPTDPSDSTPPPATMRLAHDKPARFASARNN